MKKFTLHLKTVFTILASMQNWWLPFLYAAGLKKDKSIARFRDGDMISISETDWKCVPSITRLKIRLGIRVQESGKDIQLSFPDGVTFQLERHGIFWQMGVLNEVWDWDDYQVRGRDLTGETVVDIGGYFGDSALLFASLGAEVHVFEPFNHAVDMMRRNLSLSGEIGKRVHVHPVGLSVEDNVIPVNFDSGKGSFATTDENSVGPNQEMIRLVDTGRYLKEAGLSKVDILKIDCEGSEYALFEKRDLLDILDPSEIMMEFHDSSEILVRELKARNYMTYTRGLPKYGMLFARKAGHFSADGGKFNPTR